MRIFLVIFKFQKIIFGHLRKCEKCDYLDKSYSELHASFVLKWGNPFLGNMTLPWYLKNWCWKFQARKFNVLSFAWSTQLEKKLSLLFLLIFLVHTKTHNYRSKLKFWLVSWWEEKEQKPCCYWGSVWFLSFTKKKMPDVDLEQINSIFFCHDHKVSYSLISF